MAHDLDKKTWELQGEEKADAVQEMFAEITPVYDRMNGIMSLSLHHRWRKNAVQKLELKKGQTAIDICCGTGAFLRPLLDSVGVEGKLIGVDFCEPILEKCKDSYGQHVELRLADACDLPYENETFDGATMGWGIRNVKDISLALSEVYRVLKPNSRFVCLEMAQPENSIVRLCTHVLFHRVIPVIWKLLGNEKAGQYLSISTNNFISRVELKKSMELVGFKQVQWKDLFFGNITMHWGTK